MLDYVIALRRTDCDVIVTSLAAFFNVPWRRGEWRQERGDNRWWNSERDCDRRWTKTACRPSDQTPSVRFVVDFCAFVAYNIANPHLHDINGAWVVVFTDRVSKGGNAIASVCLSVPPSVSTLNSEPSGLWPCPFACVWFMTMGFKVKVKGQGHGYRLELGYQGSQFEKRSVGPRSSVEDSFIVRIVVGFVDFFYATSVQQIYN